MVEDLNYARSVRDSGGRSAGAIGIATITSIAVGVLAVLAFICLVFLALARRRRALKRDGGHSPDDSMSALPISTPTQSRTTYSPAPPGTPSGVGIPPDRCPPYPIQIPL